MTYRVTCHYAQRTVHATAEAVTTALREAARLALGRADVMRTSLVETITGPAGDELLMNASDARDRRVNPAGQYLRMRVSEDQPPEGDETT